MSACSAATTKRGPPRTDMDSHLRGNGNENAGCFLPIARRTAHRRVQRDAAGSLGVSPKLLILHPRLGGRGLKTSVETAVKMRIRCWWVQPILRLDSRLRGNDKRNAECSRPGTGRTVPPDEVQETSCRESEGVPQIPSLLPPRLGARELKTSSTTAMARVRETGLMALRRGGATCLSS